MNRTLTATTLALLILAAAPAAGGPPSEYEVKAAFLLNFARLVSWPEGTFATPDEPLRVGSFGEDPFDGALESIVAGREIGGRRLSVETLGSSERARGVHLLFVPADETESLPELAEALSDAPVLLVGESEGFAVAGGAINLYEEGGRIRFEINRRAAEARGLKLSSRLLRLARLVGAQEP